MQTMIHVANMSKSFNDKKVLNNCNLEVGRGEIYGLVGKNGSGKSTLFKILTGLMKCDYGTSDILQKGSVEEDRELLSEIGLLIEMPIFYEHLTAIDNLKIHLAYMKSDIFTDEIMRILKEVGLPDITNSPVSKFSLGMRQRLAIARAIIHKPKILILDEPLNGLDPKGIMEMREIFLKLKDKGTTIIISSHILSELEKISDIIGVLSEGKIIKEIEVSKVDKSLNLEESLLEYF